MSRATLTAAKAELVALLVTSDTPTITGVGVVYDHLPPRSVLTEPVAVAVFTDSIDENFWNIGVALFVNTTDNAKTAQDTLDTLMPAIDARTNTGGYGPARWQISYPTGDTGTHYIATCVYQVGRQDI